MQFITASWQRHGFPPQLQQLALEVDAQLGVVAPMSRMLQGTSSIEQLRRLDLSWINLLQQVCAPLSCCEECRGVLICECICTAHVAAYEQLVTLSTLLQGGSNSLTCQHARRLHGCAGHATGQVGSARLLCQCRPKSQLLCPAAKGYTSVMLCTPDDKLGW